MDRHLADAAALLSPEEGGVVVFVPPGLGASRQAIGSWAERHHMVADFAAPEPDEEGQGELVRLRLPEPGASVTVTMPLDSPSAQAALGLAEVEDPP
ncbi:MAG TPA: hypothetical protein VNZ67_04345 [bacterium]|nr:hypothetical protein [bacterium]